MSTRGFLLVLGAATAAGVAFVVLRRPPSLEVKVPGPCEIRQVISYPDTELPPVSPTLLVHRYDAEGQLVQVQRHNEGGSLAQTTRNVYDEAGNRILEEHTHHGPIQVTAADGTNTTETDRVTRTRWTYDDAGRTLTQIFDEGEGTDPTLQTTYAYDANGHHHSSHTEREGGKTSDTDYEVDAQGRVLALQTRGKSHPMRTYAYDAQGNVLKEVEGYDTDGNANRTIERTYDEAGRQIRAVETLSFGPGMQERREQTWTYDEVGNTLEQRERLLESPDGGSLLVVETHDYSCWSVKDGVATDERGTL